MTAIFYPDVDAASPNGKCLVQARSPHNGTINHRDGRTPSDDDYSFKYRDHQRDFRYRLLDTTRSTRSSSIFGESDANIVWERWQERNEDSPHELIISDEGWSIIRTHGCKPELIAMSPDGQEVIRVKICGPNVEDLQEKSEQIPRQENVQFWHTKHLRLSTAGSYWTSHSWRYFFRFKESIYFVWRQASGHRLVIDLMKGKLLRDEENRNPEISLSMQDFEKDGAYILLSELATQTKTIRQLLARGGKDTEGPHPLEEKLSRATSAIHLAGVYRMASCIPMLRRLEEINCPSFLTHSTAMGYGWSIEVQFFRPIIHHSLRLLGEEPLGFATYHFRLNDKTRFPTPERIADRQARAEHITREIAAKQILQMIGSPDHVKKRSHQVGRIFRWSEVWEYDFRMGDQWSTLRITWEEEGRNGRISDINTVPPYWLQSAERESEILEFL